MRIISMLVFGFLLSGCTASELKSAHLATSEAIQTPIALPSQIEVSAWLPWWDWNSAVNSAQNTPALTTISPFIYVIESNGTISKKQTVPNSLLEKFTVLPSISHDLEANRVTAILKDPSIRANHINQLVELAQPYDGIEIDYENLPIEHKDDFSNFIEELATSLHAQDKLLAVALHAKTNDVIAYAGAGALDYQRICAAADICRIMAYDFHYSGSPIAGAVAPIYWIKEVIEYAQRHIPNDKLVLALPLYGYSWSEPSRGVSKTQTEIARLLQDPAYEAKFDDNSQTPYLIDGQTQLWYDNEQSLAIKIDYAKSQGIYQFAFWRIGSDEGMLNKLF